MAIRIQHFSYCSRAIKEKEDAWSSNSKFLYARRLSKTKTCTPILGEHQIKSSKYFEMVKQEILLQVFSCRRRLAAMTASTRPKPRISLAHKKAATPQHPSARGDATTRDASAPIRGTHLTRPYPYITHSATPLPSAFSYK